MIPISMSRVWKNINKLTTVDNKLWKMLRSKCLISLNNILWHYYDLKVFLY